MLRARLTGATCWAMGREGRCSHRLGGLGTPAVRYWVGRLADQPHGQGADGEPGRLSGSSSLLDKRRPFGCASPSQSLEPAVWPVRSEAGGIVDNPQRFVTGRTRNLVATLEERDRGRPRSEREIDPTAALPHYTQSEIERLAARPVLEELGLLHVARRRIAPVF